MYTTRNGQVSTLRQPTGNLYRPPQQEHIVILNRIAPILARRFALPLFSAVQCGFPSPADDYLEAEFDFQAQLVRNPAATFVVQASGDSMTGAGIHSGDRLIVDKSVRPQDGDVVVACLDGQFNCKRFSIVRGKPMLVTESDTHPPVPVSAAEVTIWGVVMHVIHSPRQVRNAARRRTG